MAKIEFLHIHKRYGKDFYAVRDFNLTINDGEFVVLVGPSGCGKTTVLRMVAGLERITDGQLFIDGKPANELEPKDREVAMVFQDYSLFPNMTVYENIEFALKMKKVPKDERRAAVTSMAEMLGIEDLLDRRAKGLSGGQCQRIAIGRALVCRPEIFLLDEPLSNLDSQMRTHLREQISDIQKKLGITTIYVTHDQVEAMSMGDRIVVMSEGEIRQADTPQNLYYKPENTFIAKYIGQKPMHFFHAECISDSGSVRLKSPYIDTILPKWKAQQITAKGYLNKEVLVGVRPKDLRLIPENDAGSDNVFTDITFRYIENYGYYSDVSISVGGDILVAEYTGDEKLLSSGQLAAEINIEAIQIFDKENGESIVH